MNQQNRNFTQKNQLHHPHFKISIEHKSRPIYQDLISTRVARTRIPSIHEYEFRELSDSSTIAQRVTEHRSTGDPNMSANREIFKNCQSNSPHSPYSPHCPTSWYRLNSSKTEQTEELISSEHFKYRTCRTAHRERTVRTPNTELEILLKKMSKTDFDD